MEAPDGILQKKMRNVCIYPSLCLRNEAKCMYFRYTQAQLIRW